MKATTLIRKLADQQIFVTAENDELVIDAPAGAITDQIRATIRQHRPKLLAALAPEFNAQDIRDKLLAGFVDDPLLDRIMRQFDERSQNSLRTQYPRLGPGERAWQAAWEMRVQYGAWPKARKA